MNLHAEADGIKMIDLLESDLAQGFLGHIKNWVGRAALAKKGFNDKGVFDKAVDSMVQIGKSKAKTDKDLKKVKAASDKLQASWELVRGIPIDKDVPDSIKKPLRALRKAAGVSKLGKLAFAQGMETGRMAAAVSVHRLIEGIPALPKLIRDSKTGKLSDTFLQDIETAGYGRIGDEYLLSHPSFRIEELHEGAFKGERAIDAMSYTLNNLSGFNGVMKIQKRLFARQYGMKLWKELTTDKLSKAVANDLGFDEKTVKGIKSMMEKYAEPKEGLFKQGVANLNVRKWNPELREKFIAALHKKSSNAIQKIHVGDIPLWAHHTYGQFFSQFRSFGLASAGKHGVHDIRMGKAGNLEGINAFLFSTLFASMLYIGKTEIDSFGLEPRKRRKYLKNRLKATQIATNSSRYMSQLGLLPDAGLYLGAGLFPDALGQVTWGRTGAMTPADIISGIPGIDYAGDLTKTGQEIFQSAVGQDEFTDSDFKAAWGLLPMNNLIGVTNIKNVLENNFEE